MSEAARANHRRPQSGWPTGPRMTECRHMLLKSEVINYCVSFYELLLLGIASWFVPLTSKPCHFKCVKQMQFLEYISLPFKISQHNKHIEGVVMHCLHPDISRFYGCVWIYLSRYIVCSMDTLCCSLLGSNMDELSKLLRHCTANMLQM
jgi:hypothetical protein